MEEAGAVFVSTFYLDTEVACFDDNNIRAQFQEFINAVSVSGKILLFPTYYIELFSKTLFLLNFSEIKTIII